MVAANTTIGKMFRHVPGTDDTAAELWCMGTANSQVYRCAGGTVSTAPTLKDAVGNLTFSTAASLNGKLFIAAQPVFPAPYRLHVWDPNATGGASVRRVGIAAMPVPAIADNGVGAYPAVLRYYRTRAVTQSGGVTISRSEPSPSVGFTPSGGALAARVTQGTPPGENETHWEVEASTDNAFFFVIATVAIGTTFYNDLAAPSTYLNNPASPVINTYRLPVCARYIAADQSRLLLFGDWLETNPQNRVYYTPVLGASDVSDDERVPLNNYYTLDEKDSGIPTGICGPVNGSFLVFKYRQTWKMTATGLASDPYTVFPVSKTVGCISHSSATIGEDEAGNAAVYFMSARGPYRYGVNGLQYLGKHLEDRILPGGDVSTLFLDAVNAFNFAWSIWYGDRRQVWLSFPTGSSPFNSTVVVYNLGSITTPTSSAEPSGWSVFTGLPIAGFSSVMFSNTIGASMSRDLKPYIGFAQPVKADTGTTDTDGIGQPVIPYRSYVTTRAYNSLWPNYHITVQSVSVAAKAVAATSVSVSVVNGSGVETRTETVSLAPDASETRIVRRVGGAAQTANAPWVQFTVGDATAIDNSWSIDGIIASYLQGSPFDS